MLQLLNLAIGLTFVFLLFSLVVTALSELLLSVWDERARFLREGIERMLGGQKEHIADFFKHGLIQASCRKAGKTAAPAYLPCETFATVVLDLISQASPGQTRNAAAVRAGLDSLSGPLQKSLAALFERAGGDLARFEKELQLWFTHSMDRVSGWFKRYAQQTLFGLAVLLAVAGNVDSIHIARSLTADPQLLDAVVRQAVQLAEKERAPGDGGTAQQTTVLSEDAVKKAIENFQTSVAQLNNVNLPLGWGESQTSYFIKKAEQKDPAPVWKRIRWGNWASALFGWLLTALAASLGAPFWFDTLNRLVMIRGNGRTPREADTRRAESAAKLAALTAGGQ